MDVVKVFFTSKVFQSGWISEITGYSKLRLNWKLVALEIAVVRNYRDRNCCRYSKSMAFKKKKKIDHSKFLKYSQVS